MKKPVILCVDDEKMVLNTISRVLEKAFGNDYNIEIAEDGIDALEFFIEMKQGGSEVPVVIADYIMPNIKGDELLMKIHEYDSSAYNIMLTGQATMEGVTNAVNKANLYRYIAKPWDNTDLLLTIGEALKGYYKDKELFKKNLQLERANKELKSANEKLESLDTAKNHFMGLLSHELNTPLIGINGSAKTILEITSDGDVKECCADILNSEARLRKFAEISMLITNLKAENYKLKESEEQVSDIVQESAFLLRDKADDKKIEIKIDFESDYSIKADRYLILKALGFILDNAVKFSSENSSIFIKGLSHEDRFLLKIKDSGPGFSEEAVKDLFKEFQTGDLLHHGSGSGLSLAAAKMIMDSHGFGIIGNNHENGGAEITLSF